MANRHKRETANRLKREMANRFKREYFFNVSSLNKEDIEKWLKENKIEYRFSTPTSLCIKKKKEGELFTLRWGVEGKAIRTLTQENEHYTTMIWTMKL